MNAPDPPAPAPPAPVLPQRRNLPHEIPPWVSQGARHFITITALYRDTSPFASAAVASVLLQNLLVYQSLGKWHLWLALIMPDHIHFIATFNMDYGIEASVSAWKGYQSKTLKLDFQSGFFEHRLRNEEAFREKMAYVRANPERKGLVADAADWPYVYEHGRT
jgi:putative transposase